MTKNQTQSDTKGNFNPTVTAFFDSPKFAAKALKGEENAAFISAVLDEKAVATLQNITEGERLLLKRSPKLNKNGGSTFYLEVLPPYTGNGNTVDDGI